MHGKTDTAEHRIWRAMLNRCSNPNFRQSKDYRDRGIKVCREWQDSFECFFREVGPRPSSSHTLERENNDGNYEPGNVRWATRFDQCNNTRRNRIVSVRGQSMTLQQAVNRFGGNYGTIKSRLNRGLSAERAFGLE
jgi:hypothetical protein